MMCWSYGVFFGLPSASFSLAIASGNFFACRASWAAFRVGASSLLTFCLFLSSAANAGWPDSRAVAPTMAAPTTRTPTAFLFAFMMSFRIVGLLVLEVGGVRAADLLRAVARGRGQHLRHVVVLGTTVGAQVNLRLHVLLRFLVEV